MPDKLYYSIGEVADIFKVNPSLIRFWEKEFDIISPQKNRKGNRLFTKQDIENIRIIYDLVKEKGFTLQGARDHLKEHKQEKPGKQEVIRSLEKIRQALLDLEKEI